MRAPSAAKRTNTRAYHTHSHTYSQTRAPACLPTQEVLSKLSKSLEHTEEQIKKVSTEAKALGTEADAVERAATKVAGDVRQVEEEMLMALGDQTTVEKGAGKTVADTMELRKRIRTEELAVVETENELAKLQVDILNTEAHNARLQETLALLEEELTDKAATIDKYELEIKRRNDEIEKKTREIDLLNRRYERMVDSMVGEDTGPLEATIRNLQKEIDTKGGESKELQRRWIAFQTELVALQNENGQLTETLARMRAENTVLFQKKRRLEGLLTQHEKEGKVLASKMGRLRVELGRVNALIADNASARAALAEDNFNLENRIVGDLGDMEREAAKMSSAIDEGRAQKRDVLSEIVEAERQIMLWERKIQLEKEVRRGGAAQRGGGAGRGRPSREHVGACSVCACMCPCTWQGSSPCAQPPVLCAGPRRNGWEAGPLTVAPRAFQGASLPGMQP